MKTTVVRLTYIPHDPSISDPHLLTETRLNFGRHETSTVNLHRRYLSCYHSHERYVSSGAPSEFYLCLN